jgi:hypothetical protein
MALRAKIHHTPRVTDPELHGRQDPSERISFLSSPLRAAVVGGPMLPSPPGWRPLLALGSRRVALQAMSGGGVLVRP